MDFCLFCMFFFKVITNLIFNKLCFYQIQPSEAEAFLYHRMVSCVPKKPKGLALWIKRSI